MVYSNKFVACVLLNGEPQSELANGTVKLPFGAEYELRFRNKNNRRAVVKIFIDGENVSGGGYIINANDQVDIKRHHDVDRAFKFVSLDSGEAVEHGKNGPNDDKVKGTIEARFYLEKETVRPVVVDHHHHHHHYPKPSPMPYPRTPWDQMWMNTGTIYSKGMDLTSAPKSATRGRGLSMGPSGSATGSEYLSAPEAPTVSMNSGDSYYSSPDIARGGILNDEGPSCMEAGFIPAASMSAPEVLKDGCTVEGDTTGQSFHQVWIDLEDAYTSLKLFLQGYTVQQTVVAKSQKKSSKTNKLSDLEAENEELRKQLAEQENANLKLKLEKAKAESEKG